MSLVFMNKDHEERIQKLEDWRKLFDYIHLRGRRPLSFLGRVIAAENGMERVERKLDLIMEYLGVEYVDPETNIEEIPGRIRKLKEPTYT